MEKHDTLRNLLISAGVFALVLWASSLLMPPPRSVPGPSAAPAGATPGGLAGPASAGETPLTASTPPEPVDGFTVREAPEAQRVFLGAESPPGASAKDLAKLPYRMHLTLSNVGASVASAAMTDHAATLAGSERYQLLSPVSPASGPALHSLAVEQINIDGVNVSLADRRWQVLGVEPYEAGGENGQKAAFQIEIAQGGESAFRITREYRLPGQPAAARRHDLYSMLRIENLTTKPHRVVVGTRGGLGIPMAGARGDDRFIDWGLWDGTRVTGNRKSMAEVSRDPSRPVKLFAPTAGGSERFSWAATANTYFTCTIAPLGHDETAPASHLAEVAAVDLDGDPSTSSDATLRFVTQPETLGPGSALAYPQEIYLGEKDGIAFNSVAAYKSRNYYFQIAQGFGWCTFTWLVELMIWLLNGLNRATRDYGAAIVILVLIVRLLLHPITKKGQVNMVRMQHSMGQLAPKLEEIKRRYANDKARIQQETMQVYREFGVNPATQLLTCLPMFIQMPIWVALFLSLSNNIHMRHEAAFWGLTWIRDMTAPDALIAFSSPFRIPLVGWSVASFNLLPIFVAVFMYLQQKLQPKPAPNPNLSDQQRQQQEMMQKMMPMMSIMMLILFYNAPSGLNLYIMFSSLFGTIEQHRIRSHIKEREAAGTLHKTRPRGDDADGGKKKGVERAAESPRGRIHTWFERLQKMAEDAQKAQPKRQPRGKARR